MISEQKHQVLDLFAKGRNQYKLMEFGTALETFEQALKIDPGDGPCKVYAERCRHYVAQPPAEDWDGVYVMTTK